MGSTCTKNSSRTKNSELLEDAKTSIILRREHDRILQEKITYDYSESLKIRNLQKNRYLNIPCFDYNRVKLPNDGLGDYINASHVDGYKAKGRFICTQAPLEETVHDFWRLVWGYQVQVIVMLAKIEEEESEACHQYWSPVEGSTVTYGKFSIKTVSIKTHRCYVVTSLRIACCGAIQEVKHFAYTDWPRSGVPSDRSEFLKFALDVRKADLEAKWDSSCKKENPIVVHCSGGSNRTGTFCALDICISRYDESGIIDLSSAVRKLRKQRYQCLSLSNHYVFCYQIMLNYIKLADKL